MVKKITSITIIEQYLNDYGRKYYLRELASVLKKPHQTVKPYVENLVKEGILVKNKRRNLTEYSLNLKDKKMYDYLIIAEKEKLMGRLKEDVFLAVLFEKLSAFFEKNTFVIFGSAADKTLKHADIDLLVVGKKNISGEIEDFEKVYSKKIHKIQITSLERLSLTFIKELYRKHIIFDNTEQIVRFFGVLYEQNKLV